MPDLSSEDARRLIGVPLTDTQASVLADWYTNLAAAVARFPEADLRRVEPPLRSTPAPKPQ
jgi:hypothetical protein